MNVLDEYYHHFVGTKLTTKQVAIGNALVSEIGRLESGLKSIEDKAHTGYLESNIDEDAKDTFGEIYDLCIETLKGE